MDSSGRRSTVADAPQEPHYNPDPHAHPGLHAIAIFEAAKGLLALLAASGLEILGPVPLQRWLHELINRFQLDPRHGAIDWLSHTINPDSVHLTAAIVLGYAVLRFIEAWGLWRVRSWVAPSVNRPASRPQTQVGVRRRISAPASGWFISNWISMGFSVGWRWAHCAGRPRAQPAPRDGTSGNLREVRPAGSEMQASYNRPTAPRPGWRPSRTPTS